MSVVKLADFFHIDAEAAVRDASQRFQQRFDRVKAICPVPVGSLTLAEKIQWFKVAKKELESEAQPKS